MTHWTGSPRGVCKSGRGRLALYAATGGLLASAFRCDGEAYYLTRWRLGRRQATALEASWTAGWVGLPYPIA